MKAVILAAGISKRLRPLTDKMPKCLIEINGKSLIEKNIDILKTSGIHDITVVVGYLRESIENRLTEKYNGIKFVYNPSYADSGSGYSLFLGVDSLDVSDILFMDADILIHPDILSDIKNVTYPSFLYVSANECDHESVKVVVYKDGNLKLLSKTISADEHVLGESIGIVKFNIEDCPHVVDFMKKKILDGNLHFEWEEIFNENRSIKLKTVIKKLPWIEIDFPEDIKRAQGVYKEICNTLKN